MGMDPLTLGAGAKGISDLLGNTGLSGLISGMGSVTPGVASALGTSPATAAAGGGFSQGLGKYLGQIGTNALQGTATQGLMGLLGGNQQPAQAPIQMPPVQQAGPLKTNLPVGDPNMQHQNLDFLGLEDSPVMQNALRAMNRYGVL